MLDFVSGVGAWIISLVITFGSLFACAMLGIWTTVKNGKRWLGWSVGIAVYAATQLLFFGPLAALTEMKCRAHADYERCMND